MDPLSIATSCLGLVSAIATISKAVNELTSELRDAKDELSRVSNELASLQVPLRHIGNRAQASGDSGVPIAAELQTQIKKIVANCRTVVEEIGRIIDKCSTRRRGARSVGWVLVRSDVNRLRSSLESHKIALNIALSLVDSELSKAIQDDTRHIRSQVAGISSDVGRVQNDTANIAAQNSHLLSEIQSMRVLAPQETVTNGQILDAIQNILSRLSMEAPPESIPLQEHLEIMRELTRNQAPPDDNDPWVDWVADPKPGYSFSSPIAATRPQRHRALSQSLIVAIDYGVSFTSVAFAWSNAESLDDIQVLCNFPGNDRQSFSKQVPSVVAYASENVELCQDVWGFLVPPGIKACRGTKLLIDECFTDAGDVGIDLGLDPLRIPVGKTAKDVVADYLGGLRRAIYDEMCIKMGEAMVSVTPISFWLTVPAIWSDRAKMLLKEAATEAGLISKPSDSILLLPEPEAAAHAALNPVLKQPYVLLRPGSSIIVCDCGDRATDITAYKVRALQPSLQLKEICVGTGGTYGRHMVNLNFRTLMQRRFGTAFTSLGPEKTGPGSRFMTEFEMAMSDFYPANSKRRVLRFHLRMRVLPSWYLGLSEYYDDDDDDVLLRSPEDVRPLFDPVVEGIISLLNKQTSEIREAGTGPVERVILHGAFSGSLYVQQKISAWCSAQGIRLINPQAGGEFAVVQGAVMFGLGASSTVGGRKCRRHFGIGTSKPYDPSVHSRYDATNRRVWRNGWDNDRRYLSGFITWTVNRGVPIGDGSEFSNDLLLCLKHTHNIGEKLLEKRKLTLYDCPMLEPPETIESDSVKNVAEIEFSIGNLDLSTVPFRVVNNERWLRVAITANIRFSDDSLMFRILCGGREIGSCFNIYF